jgi:hypothetical protein
MKQGWARLYGNLTGNSIAVREVLFRNLFLRHHQNADEIIMESREKGGRVLGAIYLAPGHFEREEQKKFLADFKKALGWDDVGYNDNSL